jgi:hypothetical protein
LAGVHQEGGNLFGVVAKRTYNVASSSCQVAPEQSPLVEEPLFRAEEAALVHDTDLVLNRQQVDIIVDGHAYSPQSRGPFDVSIRVGSFVREIRVFGDRHLDCVNGTIHFTPALPVDRVQLSWENAYGGLDDIARRAIGDPVQEMLESAGEPFDVRFGLYAYPRNPLGKGYLIEPTSEAIAACVLPNLEDPSTLLDPDNVVRGDFMLWPRGPRVAATSWLSHNYFPRVVQCGLPPRPFNDEETRPEDFFEVSAGLVRPESVANLQTIAGRLDVRAAQQAAVGMRADFVPPGCAVELSNLRRERRPWRLTLPTEIPRMAYKLPGGKSEELEPKIRTVLLEPDLDRVTVVWVGETRGSLPVTPKQLTQVEHGVIWQS